MIVSNNSGQDPCAFENFLKRAIGSLEIEAKRTPSYYLTREGNKLEIDVYQAMNAVAKGSDFENTIRIYSGRRFPDITALQDFFGVEVKTSTKGSPWKCVGNSVLESSRIENVKKIYMVFGKLVRPVEFRFKKYEECLYDIAVTHSPRYMVDMNISQGNTIFDKIGLSYDDLRTLDNPIRRVMQYFRENLEEGQDLWWLDTGEAQVQSTGVVIKFWNKLQRVEQDSLRYKMIALFPEIIGPGPAGSDKYSRPAAWLTTKYGIVAPSFRDIFSGGRSISIKVGKRTHHRIPKIFCHIQGQINKILQALASCSDEEVDFYWKKKCRKTHRKLIWREMFIENASKVLAKTTLDVQELLHEEPEA
jgi:hypothetical protein